MDEKNIEFIELEHQVYKKLIEIQRKAYLEVINKCIKDIDNKDKLMKIIKMVVNIDKQIDFEVDELSKDHEKYIKHIKRIFKLNPN